MTQARLQQIHIETTPYYHCITRCVRRAFLCGKDRQTGKNYEHRKQKIVDRIKELSTIFAIDTCAYAVLSNHYHVILHIDKEKADGWSDSEVIQRWYKLYSGHPIIDKYLGGDRLSSAEFDAAHALIIRWRQRLMDISWYMRCLNEFIARESNKEDNVKGRFWEGRFKSQALMDEAALIACMMYVDLNPIRAGISQSLEQSDYTSIQERIQYEKTLITNRKTRKKTAHPNSSLLPFTGPENEFSKSGIPFLLKDYLELTHWTGKAVREDKKGAIPSHIRLILNDLQVDEHEWVNNVRYFGQRFYRAIGTVAALRNYGKQIKSQWLHGLNRCASFYKKPVSV